MVFKIFMMMMMMNLEPVFDVMGVSVQGTARTPTQWRPFETEQ